MHNLTGREKLFYEDKCSVTECKLSEETDLEFEEEKRQRIIEKEQKLEEAEKIEQFTNPIEYQEIINITPTRTRKRCSDIEEFKTPSPIDIGKNQCSSLHLQNDNKILSLTESTVPTKTDSYFPRPEIRKTRNFNARIKDTIATVSYNAAISVEKARLAVQTMCRKFYNHQYYLTSEEQAKYKPELATIEEEAELAKPSQSKKPRSADDYKSKYQYVLPDKRTVSDFKQKNHCIKRYKLRKP